MIPGTQNEFLGGFGMTERGAIHLVDEPSPPFRDDEEERPVSEEEMDYTRGLIFSEKMRSGVEESFLLRPSEDRRREMRDVVSDDEVISRIRRRRALEAKYARLEREREDKRSRRTSSSSSSSGRRRAEQEGETDSRQFRRRISYGPFYEDPLEADVEGSAFTRRVQKNQYRRTASNLERKKFEEIWALEREEEDRKDAYLDSEVSQKLLEEFLAFRKEPRRLPENVDGGEAPPFEISQAGPQPQPLAAAAEEDEKRTATLFRRGVGAFFLVAIVVLLFAFVLRWVLRKGNRREGFGRKSSLSSVPPEPSLG